MKPAAKHSTRYWGQLLAVIVVCAALPGCSETRHYHAARPVSATLEIQIQGQWKAVHRMSYLYEKPMDEWQSLPVAELDVILRDREARGIFDSETAALRSLIELKKLGLNTKEE